MSARLIAGTSGFAYADWKPRFYPDGVAQAKFLPHYATRLSGVEINYTFNRFPTEKLLDGWAGKTPEGFAFCLKTPKVITHQKRLRDCGEMFRDFATTAATLGPRSGPLLVQLAPTMPADTGLLREFLTAAPPGTRIAVEFRHPSWDDDAVRDALAGAGAAWVAAETDDAPATIHRTAPFTYLRLRRSAYDEASLSEWRGRIASLLEDGCDVHCFLRHDADGANAIAAEDLLAGFAERERQQLS